MTYDIRITVKHTHTHTIQIRTHSHNTHIQKKRNTTYTAHAQPPHIHTALLTARKYTSKLQIILDIKMPLHLTQCSDGCISTYTTVYMDMKTNDLLQIGLSYIYIYTRLSLLCNLSTCNTSDIVKFERALSQ